MNSYIADPDSYNYSLPNYIPLRGLGKSPNDALNNLIRKISGKEMSVINRGEVVDRIQFPEIELLPE